MLFRHSPPSSRRRAVITGASSGIGSAFARALAEADLLLSGRDAVALEALAAELRREGREVRVVTADLTQEAERAELIAAADEFGADLLINDAGLGTWGAFLEEEPDRQRAVIEVNVQAPVALARGILPGDIVTVDDGIVTSSAGGQRDEEGDPARKHGADSSERASALQRESPCADSFATTPSPWSCSGCSRCSSSRRA